MELNIYSVESMSETLYDNIKSNIKPKKIEEIVNVDSLKTLKKDIDRYNKISNKYSTSEAEKNITKLRSNNIRTITIKGLGAKKLKGSYVGFRDFLYHKELKFESCIKIFSTLVDMSGEKKIDEEIFKNLLINSTETIRNIMANSTKIARDIYQKNNKTTKKDDLTIFINEIEDTVCYPNLDEALLLEEMYDCAYAISGLNLAFNFNPDSIDKKTRRHIEIFSLVVYAHIYETLELLKAIKSAIYEFVFNYTEKTDEIDENDKNIDLSYEDVNIDKSFETLEFAKSVEDFEFSMEDSGTEKNKENFDPSNPKENIFAKVFTKLKELPIQANKLAKKLKLFRSKAKNYRFYKKYLGRMDHMYRRYGDEATIVENRMKGDPVQILKGPAKKYIERISAEMAELYRELSNLSKRCSNMSDPKEALAEVNRFLNTDKLPYEKMKRLPKTMVKTVKRRLANSILTDNDVYGYTVDSIVEKNFPPANHAIVSLFVENAQEKPERQSVTSILKDTEDFKIIAANEKQPIFNISEMSNNVIVTGIQSSDIKTFKKAKKIGMRALKNGVTEAKNVDKDSAKAKKRLLKQTKYIWSALEKALGYVASMKPYVFDLINGYFTMVIRIDNMTKQCVVAMLEVERMKKDERHNTGFKGDKLTKNSRLKQNDDDYTTKGEKEADKLEQVANEQDERRAKAKDRIDRIREIRKRKLNNLGRKGSIANRNRIFKTADELGLK